MVDKFTKEQIQTISLQHLNLLHDKLSDEIRYKRREIEEMEDTILLIKQVRNERRMSK